MTPASEFPGRGGVRSRAPHRWRRPALPAWDFRESPRPRRGQSQAPALHRRSKRPPSRARRRSQRGRLFRAAEHEARDQRKAFLCEQDSRHNPQSREPDGEAGHDGNLRNLIRKRIQCFPQIAFLMNFSGNPSIHRIRNAGEHKQPRSPQGLIQPQINPKEQRHHTQSEKR